MKISVIMAIFHMSIGIIMKGTNAVYFNKPVDLITEVIFGLIILLGLFGWMDALIIAKWFHHSGPCGLELLAWHLLLDLLWDVGTLPILSLNAIVVF